MLIKRRIDYVIDLPTEVQRKLMAFVKRTDEKVDIKSVAIANNPKFISGRVACTNTIEGRQFIKEVDDILVQLYQAHARTSIKIIYFHSNYV